MRRIAFASFLIVALVCTLAGGITTAAKSMRLPVDPAAVGLIEHPIVGNWLITTAADTAPAVILGNGGRDCATCAAAYNLDSVAAAGLALVEVSSAGVAYPTASIAGPDAIIGNGGRACTWCGATSAGGIPVASGSPLAVGAAEARYIPAKDAALEPAAAAEPAVTSYGGGCGTCR